MRSFSPVIFRFLLFVYFFDANVAFAQIETGKTLYKQAVDTYGKGAYEKAMTPALTADSIFQLHGNAADQLQSKTLLAKICAARRQPLQVVQFSEAAIALLGAAGKRDSLAEADILNTYGSGLLETRRFEECEAAYRRAIEIKKKVLGEQTAEIGIQVSNLANLYFKKGDLSKAMRYGREGIAIREGGISPNPKLLTAYTNLGIIHKQVGLYQQALGYFDKVAQVIRQEPEKYKDKAAPLYQSLANL